MLELHNITKDYPVGDSVVHALKGVSLAFREHELVSILGQSGCGKTTLLNIIGGLDRYTGGDLVIGGRSTVYFKSADWDAYRNHRIGFVFQSYNLIPHLTVLGNVELAMTLSGVKKSERQRRAAEALRKVGLENEMKKRPNQMSGGQMQRVAIARAIVNDPDIILADEPTGALDSTTSVQVMEILKDISKDRLVIMVTHNRTLAETYSTRIVSMLDGKVIDDTAPLDFEENPVENGAADTAEEQSIETEKTTENIDVQSNTSDCKAEQKQLEKEHKKKQKEITKANKAVMKRTSMSLWTALGLSARNLITKKGRTIATAIAGSIGIIGVALVLALSNGFTNYVDEMETTMLASYPVTVSKTTVDIDSTMNAMQNGVVKLEEFPDGNKLIIKDDTSMLSYHYNRITQDFLDYAAAMPDGYCLDITYTYAKEKIVLSKNANTGNGTGYGRVSMQKSGMFGNSALFQPLLSNSDYVLGQYDVLQGKYPSEANEIAVVVGKDNSINLSTISAMGLEVPKDKDNATFDSLIGQELKLIYNDQWFKYDEGKGYYTTFKTADATQEQLKALYDDEHNLTLKVVGVMRIKESSAMALYSTGMVYSPKLDENLIENCKNSEVGKAQAESNDKCVSDALDSILGVDPEKGFTSAGNSFSTMALAITMLYPEYKALGIGASDFKLLSLQALGASDIPDSVNFYPVNFDIKDLMNDYLSKYNDGKALKDKIIPLDAAAVVTDAVSEMIDIMTYVLVAFAAISLVVSSVMIGIITYASVVERTKEIGVLRAVGARKLDIMRLFNAEAMIIGFIAGVIGVLFTFILSFPLSAIFIAISEGVVRSNLVTVAWWHVLSLIAISVFLTFIASLIPSLDASKRDPVVALRSE